MVQKLLFLLSAVLAAMLVLFLMVWIVGGFFPELYLREWDLYFLNMIIGGLASGGGAFASVIWFYLGALIVAFVILLGLYHSVKWLLK